MSIPYAGAQEKAQPTMPSERPAQTGALRPINVGFVRHGIGAWTTSLAHGDFDTATGRTINWHAHDTDSSVVAALAAARLDIGLIGTSVVASAIARGLNLKVFYVLGGSTDSEALVATHSSGVLPTDVKSLQGKVVAVPFGSTSHFRLLESLRRWGIGVASMRIVNLQTGQIADAWKRGEIDAAVVTEPLLGTIAPSARRVPLPPSLGPTAVLVFAAANEFVAQHVVFLSRFVDVIARADLTTRALTTKPADDSPLTRSIAEVTGLAQASVSTLIERYRPPPLAEQTSIAWLAGGAEAGLVAQLKASLEVWRWAGRLTGADADVHGAAAPEPAQMALTFQR